jgi:hypothetical protein
MAALSHPGFAIQIKTSADVKGFISAEPVGHGSLDTAFGDLLTLSAGRSCATFARAAAVILELEDNRVSACRKRDLGRERQCPS